MKSKKIQKTSRKQMLSKKLFKSKKQMRYRKLKIKKTRKQRGGFGKYGSIRESLQQIKLPNITLDFIINKILGIITPPLKKLEEGFKKKAEAYNQIHSALLEVVNEKTNHVNEQIQDKLKPVYKIFDKLKQVILKQLIYKTDNTQIDMLNLIKNTYKKILLIPEQSVDIDTYVEELIREINATLKELDIITPDVEDIEKDLQHQIEKLETNE